MVANGRLALTGCSPRREDQDRDGQSDFLIATDTIVLLGRRSSATSHSEVSGPSIASRSHLSSSMPLAPRGHGDAGATVGLDGMATATAAMTSCPTPVPEPRYAAVELCCGMGGIGIGLAASGYRVIRAYDSWPQAVGIYNHNAPEPVARVCDLLSSDGYATIKRGSRRLGDVDLLAAGPPCKGFSQIRNGHHDKPNPHNRVLSAIPEYVAIFRPRLVLIENVPDLIRHRAGKTLHSLFRDLERPGPRGLRYRVECALYDAALFGTPQARRRILIFAVRFGSGDERLPEPSPDLTRLYASLRRGRRIPEEMRPFADHLCDPGDLSMTSGRQALCDLPLLSAGEPEVPRAYVSSPQNSYQQVMRASSSGPLTNMRTPAVREETLHRLALIPPGGCARDIPAAELNGLSRRYGSAYRRLHPDAPSTALSTKYDCVYHYGAHRSLSVREYARLQGIPDHISFPGELACRRYAYEMIGNAVPPLLVNGVLSQLVGSGERRDSG